MTTGFPSGSYHQLQGMYPEVRICHHCNGIAAMRAKTEANSVPPANTRRSSTVNVILRVPRFDSSASPDPDPVYSLRPPRSYTGSGSGLVSECVTLRRALVYHRSRGGDVMTDNLLESHFHPQATCGLQVEYQKSKGMRLLSEACKG